MRWVQQASIRPHRCAVNPMIGNSNATKGFFDTGVDLPLNAPRQAADRVYVSVQAVEEMARTLGWVPAHLNNAVERDLEAEKDENARLGGIVAELERKLAAVEVLKSAGYSASRKPGRPPKQKQVA